MSDFADRALLPAGMVDGLPPQAAFEAETVERLMAVFRTYGYERVKPPLIEFEATLLAGSGAALAEQTFRLMDPVSQRMLGLRPDITMQIARIATTRLAHRPRPLRLSYAGQVLRVRGSQFRPERQFGQVGAEIVGAAEAAADAEVVLMATAALAELGVRDLTVDLGLPPLVLAILDGCRLEPGAAARVRTALDRKDAAAVAGLAPFIGGRTAELLAALATAVGPAAEVLPVLMRADLPAAAATAREALMAVFDGVRAGAPDLTVSIDAVENRGFEYHTGVSFTVFARDVRGELGRGGRYRAGEDDGEPATGITLFMDALLGALPAPRPSPRVFLPKATPAGERRRLRGEGWIAVSGLAESSDPIAEARRLCCSHIWVDGQARALNPEPALKVRN